MGAYNVPLTKDYIGYVFFRMNGQQYKVGTLCADSYTLVPLKFDQWEGHSYSVKNHVEVVTTMTHTIIILTLLTRRKEENGI